MGLNLEQKKAVVADVSQRFAGAQAIVVAEFRGLEAGELTGLRAKARAQGVDLRVLKNTLAKRALAGTPFEGLSRYLVGPLLYGISVDAAAGAKVLSEFAKGSDRLVLKAAAMPHHVMDAAGVQALAALPGREELLAMLMGTMQAPVAQFVRTLNEIPSRFVRTLAAVVDAREKQGA